MIGGNAYFGRKPGENALWGGNRLRCEERLLRGILITKLFDMLELFLRNVPLLRLMQTSLAVKHLQ